jgi:hypothetical protein
MARTPTPPPNHNRWRGASTHDDPSRVPYPPGETSDFAALTTKAVTMAEKVGGIHGALLEMLEDCEAPPYERCMAATRRLLQVARRNRLQGRYDEGRA